MYLKEKVKTARQMYTVQQSACPDGTKRVDAENAQLCIDR
jgi:hypothetical protein